MDDLKAFGVPVLILSGGEPLLHPDIFEISHRAKAMGFYVGLSSNGTLIDQNNIAAIAAVGYDYVGISLDGLRETHDAFRRRQGAFDQSLQAIRYLSHLNYAGRGNKNRGDDVVHQMTRQAMDYLFDTALDWLEAGKAREFVTGNNDADGVYLLFWARYRFPQQVEHLQAKLTQWGGNASGVNVANIDNLGYVHPDTFWWHYSLGDVRQRPFSDIWEDTSDSLMAGLKQKQRPLKGRCGQCQYLAICGGNTRVRAHQLTGDFWAEDPGCYLTNEEIFLILINNQ